MEVIDPESARARGQTERDGFLYIDLDVPTAMRICSWQRALLSADGQVPEWTSVARWQIARALRALGYELGDMPVRYTSKFHRADVVSAWRTRLALVPSVAIACHAEAEKRGIKLREVALLCIASMPFEPPVLPPRSTKEEIDRLYKQQRTARNAELRRARRSGEAIEHRRRGAPKVLQADERAMAELLARAAKDVYHERFLVLCRERAARDAWHRKGGRGKEPPSTVDDHLGRKRGTFNAEKIASHRSGAEAQSLKHQRLGGMW